MAEYEKRGYLLENFRLFHLTSQTGEQVDFHYHEFCKLLFLVSGQGSYYVEGHRYALHPGDIVLIGSRSVHKPDLEPGIPYERIIIYISPDYLQQLSTLDCDLLSIFSGSKGHVLRPLENQRRKLFGIASALEQDLSQPGFGREILSGSDLARLVVVLGRNLRDESSTLPSPILPQNRRVLEIMEYLDRNLTEEIDIDNLADRFFISKYHMMRLFRKETGATIYAYLTQKRLLRARQLMAGGISATQACLSCGFHSYSSFTRAFSKYFGTTPTGRVDTTLVREEAAE